MPRLTEEQCELVHRNVPRLLDRLWQQPPSLARDFLLCVYDCAADHAERNDRDPEQAGNWAVGHLLCSIANDDDPLESLEKNYLARFQAIDRRTFMRRLVAKGALKAAVFSAAVSFLYNHVTSQSIDEEIRRERNLNRVAQLKEKQWQVQEACKGTGIGLSGVLTSIAAMTFRKGDYDPEILACQLTAELTPWLEEHGIRQQEGCALG